MRLSHPLGGILASFSCDVVGDASGFFRCMFGSIDVLSGGLNRNSAIPTGYRFLIIVRLQHLSLLPVEENSAPSGPMTGTSGFVVSCKVRLCEVGVWKFLNRRSLRSIRVAGSQYLPVA
jgi:hypothetical protein